MADKRRPNVIIIGGGFGGINAAKALARANVNVTLIDRKNHHLFQPLLYQVATASLSPADIASPIRKILSRQKNCEVILGEVNTIDLPQKQIHMNGRTLSYDYLIIAAGATHSYFGNEQWQQHAPGLKSIEDAVAIRRKILMAFESAEYEADENARRAALTFAIVGAGPTGVELAGAIKEIAAKTIQKDYRHIDTRTTRVILFEGDDRILPQFPQQLSQKAQTDLEKMGVEVRTGSIVTDINETGLYIDDEFVPVRTIFWAAGVKGSGLAKTLGVKLDRSGRVEVTQQLNIPDHPDAFVIGDLAAAKCAKTNEPVPGLAPAAIQMGTFVGRLIKKETETLDQIPQRDPFIYKDKGALAVIGKARAVARLGRYKFSGFFAWLVWSLVHIAFLVGFRNRTMVLFNWFWNWVTHSRDARLITGENEDERQDNQPESFDEDNTVPIAQTQISDTKPESATS